MNKQFIDDLVDRMGNEMTIIETNQNGVKSHIHRMEMEDKFPMICYEHTEDSEFDVSIDESKFLNDKTHDGFWILGMNDDEIVFIINLQSSKNKLIIDTFEVNTDYRGEGFGRNVISVIEDIAEHYYGEISASPFDVDAGEFWNHMDYLEWRDGNLIKQL